MFLRRPVWVLAWTNDIIAIHRRVRCFFFLPFFPHVRKKKKKKKDRPVKGKSSAYSFSPSFPPFTWLRPYAVIDFWAELFKAGLR